MNRLAKNYMNKLNKKNSLSLSRKRKHKLALRKTLIISTLVLIITVIVTPHLVSSVQNIFTNLGQITEIWYNGQPIEKVVYQGQIIWERELVTISDATYMQDLALPQNASVCANTPDRTRTTLKDRRNNQVYYIEKIGNLCWMETNLRYSGDGNYDPTWNYPDDRYATTATNTTANSNDDARPLTTKTSGYLGGTQYTQYEHAGYFNPNGSNTLDTTNPQNNITFYGYLYNWCSAMGGQANACNNTTGAPQSNFDTTQSICPAGWRLPTGGAGGEFQTMANAVGATNDATGATNLRNNFLAVYSGIYGGAFTNVGSGGYLWGSTVVAAVAANYLNFNASSVAPASANVKGNGFAVRCVS